MLSQSYTRVHYIVLTTYLRSNGQEMMRNEHIKGVFLPLHLPTKGLIWCMYVVCELFDLKQVDTALHTSVLQRCGNLFAVKRSINNKERTEMVCFSS